MSVTIDWPALTTGPSGEELALSIRDFVHARFQNIQLPGFIHKVECQKFEFGDEAPEVEIIDVVDPFPEFYESDSESEDEEGENESAQTRGFDSETVSGSTFQKDHSYGPLNPIAPGLPVDTEDNSRVSSLQSIDSQPRSSVLSHRPVSQPSTSSHPLPLLRTNLHLVNQLASPLLPRSSTAVWTPGIIAPHSQANLGYFPLAYHSSQAPSIGLLNQAPSLSPRRNTFDEDEPTTRPSTAHTNLSNLQPHPLESAESQTPGSRGNAYSRAEAKRSPNDLQLHVSISYTGSLLLSLTADLLIDYPAPGFIQIPLKLSVTRLDFAGEAIIAIIGLDKKKSSDSAEPSMQGDQSTTSAAEATEEDVSERKACFCFMPPSMSSTPNTGTDSADQSRPHASILRNLHVESEIGSHTPETAPTLTQQTQSQPVAQTNTMNPLAIAGGLNQTSGQTLRLAKGASSSLTDNSGIGSGIGTNVPMLGVGLGTGLKTKQHHHPVLKNVGKVEKFVLEQVRRIFEEELLWPSFWTFLI